METVAPTPDDMQGGADLGADPNADPAAMGGDDTDVGADPNVDGLDNEPGGDDQVAPHSAFMGGEDSQHPASDQMLTQDDTYVSPEEQQAYDDFVTRALLFMNDPRIPAGKNGKPDNTRKAPRDVIIDHLNIKGMPADVAVGRTTAQICWLIFSNALHNGVHYPPDVLYHGSDEVMSHVYEIGVQSGAIKNPPPPDSPEEQHLLGMAKMYATEFFGDNVINAGLDNQDEARQFYLQQIKREADSGAMENWNPGDQMSPAQLNDFLARSSQGKASLASMRAKPPSSISDYQSRGSPSLSAAIQQQQQAPPPDQGAAGQQGGGGDFMSDEEAQQQ
jgi:hypothetical protein